MNIPVTRYAVAAVLEAHKDEIGSHYQGCWKNHVACLAVLIHEELEETE